MRSMTFDMVGMALMALAVIVTCGGMLMWGYVAEARGSTARPALEVGESDLGQEFRDR